MARKAKGAGFKMRSGGSTSFKMMGSSPVKLETVPVEVPPSAEEELASLQAYKYNLKKEGTSEHSLVDEYHDKDLYGIVDIDDFLKGKKKQIKAEIKIQKKVVKAEQKENETKNLYEFIMSEDSPRGNTLRREVMRLRRLSGERGTATELGWDHHGKTEGILEKDAPTSGKLKIPKNIREYAFSLYEGKIDPKVIETRKLRP